MWLGRFGKRQVSQKARPKQVAVFARRKDIVIHAYHWTDSGFWLAGLPAICVGLDTAPAELGRVTREILKKSGALVRTPLRDEYPAYRRPLLEALGARTWSDIEHRSRLCLIRQHSSDELTIVPTRNGGGRGAGSGFHDLTEHVFAIRADVTPEELGAAVRRGLEESR